MTYAQCRRCRHKDSDSFRAPIRELEATYRSMLFPGIGDTWAWEAR